MRKIKKFMYKIHFNLKSFDVIFLNATEKYLLTVFSFFNLSPAKNRTVPIKCKKITVLRSPHIDKKSREQFQMLTHKKKLILSVSSKSIVLVLFEILKNIKFNGVEVEILVEFSTF